MTRTGLAIRWFYLLHFGAMGAYLPYFPAWLEAQGIVGFRMSVLAALLPTLSVLSPAALGTLADAFGLRGSLLRVATLGACLALAALTLSELTDASIGYWTIFACVAAFAFFRTPMQLMGDVIALEEPEDYGRIRMWGSIGFMVAAPVVGRMWDQSPLWVLPASIALPLLGTHVVSLRLPRNAPLPKAPAVNRVARLLEDSRYRALLLATVLGHGAHAVYELCISLKLRDLGVSGTAIGLAWTIATLFEVLLLGVSRRVFARFSPAPLLLLSLLVGAARWVFLSEVTDLYWLLLFQPIHSITFGLRWVASVALIKRFGGADALATSQGLFLTATAIGSAGGFLVWGTLYERIGSKVFLAASLVAMMAAASTLPLLRRPAPTASG